jgi:hypothetical protein
MSKITTKLFSCFICSIKFDQLTLYKRHLERHRDKSNDTKDNINNEILRIKEIKNHTCNSCSKSYKCLHIAKSHTAICGIEKKKIPISGIVKKSDVYGSLVLNNVEDFSNNITNPNPNNNIINSNNTQIINNIQNIYHIHLNNVTDDYSKHDIDESYVQDMFETVKPYMLEIQKIQRQISNNLLEYNQMKGNKDNKYYRINQLIMDEEATILRNFEEIKCVILECMELMFEGIYFNQQNPKYHVIYVPNEDIHLNYYIVKNYRWSLGDLELWQQISRNLFNHIVKHADTNKKRITHKEYASFCEILKECYKKTYKEILNSIVKRIHYIAYQNRHIIEPIYKETKDVKFHIQTDIKSNLESTNSNLIQKNIQDKTNKNSPNKKETNYKRNTNNKTNINNKTDTNNNTDINNKSDKNMKNKYIKNYNVSEEEKVSLKQIYHENVKYLMFENIIYEHPGEKLNDNFEFEDLIEVGRLHDKQIIIYK